MNNNDVTEITCGGCNAGHDWYCAGCWNGIMEQLQDADIQRDAAKWREKLAVSQLEEVRATLERFREGQRATAEGWRHEVAEIAGLVGAQAHTYELAHFVQNVVNDRDAARQRVAELEQLLALRAQS